jgi:hypothetical protein
VGLRPALAGLRWRFFDALAKIVQEDLEPTLLRALGFIIRFPILRILALLREGYRFRFGYRAVLSYLACVPSRL